MGTLTWGSGKVVIDIMKHAKDVVERPMDNTMAIEKVSSYLAMNPNVFSSKEEHFYS
jgi:hypothetical protein